MKQAGYAVIALLMSGAASAQLQGQAPAAASPQAVVVNHAITEPEVRAAQQGSNRCFS